MERTKRSLRSSRNKQGQRHSRAPQADHMMTKQSGVTGRCTAIYQLVALRVEEREIRFLAPIKFPGYKCYCQPRSAFWVETVLLLVEKILPGARGPKSVIHGKCLCLPPVPVCTSCFSLPKLCPIFVEFMSTCTSGSAGTIPSSSRARPNALTMIQSPVYP